MNTAALIVAWWFLATSSQTMMVMSPAASPAGTVVGLQGEPIRPPPAAFGPYPTEAMCIAATHLAAPTDRRFWDAGELAKWAPYDKNAARAEAASKAYAARMDQLARENPKPGHYQLPDGTKFMVAEPMYIDDLHRRVSVEAFSNQIEEKFFSGIPNIGPPEHLTDEYTINQPCAAVKGWYARKP